LGPGDPTAAALAAAVEESGGYVLDLDAHSGHNRTVLALTAGSLLGPLLRAISTAVERLDLRTHAGVHPRVGVADVVPVVPLGSATLKEAAVLAHALGAEVWERLRVPVYFYGAAARGPQPVRLADIRAGRVPAPDLGGSPHPSAGACCIGARPPLVACNVLLPGQSLVEGQALARAIRESAGGMPGVQALAFALPDGSTQLSMNLTRLEVSPLPAVLARVKELAGEVRAEELVGLCPAAAAAPAAAGRLLEARLAAAAARAGAGLAAGRGDEEGRHLGARLLAESDSLAKLGTGQEELLGGAERAAALPRVLRAGEVLRADLESMLDVAARGLRAAVSAETAARFSERVRLLDAWLAG